VEHNPLLLTVRGVVDGVEIEHEMPGGPVE
jgi:hypothetical protein